MNGNELNKVGNVELNATGEGYVKSPGCVAKSKSIFSKISSFLISRRVKLVGEGGDEVYA